MCLNSSFRKCILTMLATALLSTSASAADQGFYIGAAAAHLSEDFGSPPLDTNLDEDTGFKIIGGFQVLKWLALEANYVDFGDASAPVYAVCPAIVGYPCPTGVEADANAFAVSSLVTWRLPLVDLYARVGLSRWKVAVSQKFDSGQDASMYTERGTDPEYGAGAAVKFGSWSLRAEYEHFKLDHDFVEATSVGITYAF